MHVGLLPAIAQWQELQCFVVPPHEQLLPAASHRGVPRRAVHEAHSPTSARPASRRYYILLCTGASHELNEFGQHLSALAEQAGISIHGAANSVSDLGGGLVMVDALRT